VNWIGRQWPCQVVGDACRKAHAVQVGWHHLPVTLYPVIAFLFGWRSPAAWLCLALVFVCNWRWPLGFVRWAGRHKLDAAMGACAAAALACLYPFLSDIYANRPREVAASSPLPTGFYLGEYHSDSWWQGEPAPAVHYGLYVPPNLAGQKGPFPLIVFLHGYGERSTTRIFKAGLPLAITQRFGAGKPNSPFLFVAFFPIDPTGRWEAGSAEVEGAMKALDRVIERHHIDSSRVYLTGLSNGGSGVWTLAESYPDRWAAVAPVCSFISPDVSKVRHLPAWIFHGDKDVEAPVQRERDLVRHLTEAGAEVRYTEVPNQGHGMWAAAYEPKELYEWFASKKKG
jgi:predicted esterase